MGVLTVNTRGSFPAHNRTFKAENNGHAHAVAEAIQFLSTVVLPEAIERDHRLSEQGARPIDGFDRPKLKGTIHNT